WRLLSVEVGAWLQPDQAEIDRIHRVAGEQPEEILFPRQHDSEPEKTGTELVGAADGRAPVVELDDTAGIKRPEDRPGLTVDQDGVRLFQRSDLIVDARRVEGTALRVEADRRYV